MFDEKCFFINAKMTKSSQKKGNNYFCNLHTLKAKKNISAPELRMRPWAPVGGGLQPCARAARELWLVYAPPAPGVQGGLRQHARSALTSPASGGQGGSGGTSERRACPFLIDIHLI